MPLTDYHSGRDLEPGCPIVREWTYRAYDFLLPECFLTGLFSESGAQWLTGEVFCQSGLDIKAASRFPFTFPVELANGCVGYVPTEDALGEHGGGYETRLTSYTNLQPDAGRKLIAAALELAGQLKAGPVVSTRPAPPFESPWSYGNVPPELR